MWKGNGQGRSSQSQRRVCQLCMGRERPGARFRFSRRQCSLGCFSSLKRSGRRPPVISAHNYIQSTSYFRSLIFVRIFLALLKTSLAWPNEQKGGSPVGLLRSPSCHFLCIPVRLLCKTVSFRFFLFAANVYVQVYSHVIYGPYDSTPSNPIHVLASYSFLYLTVVKKPRQLQWVGRARFLFFSFFLFHFVSSLLLHRAPPLRPKCRPSASPFRLFLFRKKPGQQIPSFFALSYDGSRRNGQSTLLRTQSPYSFLFFFSLLRSFRLKDHR